MIAANELTGAVRLEVLARDINSLQAQIGNRTPNKCMAYVWEVMVFVIEMRMVREIVDLTGRPHDRWGIINVGQITNPQLSQCFPRIDNNIYSPVCIYCRASRVRKNQGISKLHDYAVLQLHPPSFSIGRPEHSRKGLLDLRSKIGPIVRPGGHLFLRNVPTGSVNHNTNWNNGFSAKNQPIVVTPAWRTRRVPTLDGWYVQAPPNTCRANPTGRAVNKLKNRLSRPPCGDKSEGKNDASRSRGRVNCGLGIRETLVENAQSWLPRKVNAVILSECRSCKKSDTQGHAKH